MKRRSKTYLIAVAILALILWPLASAATASLFDSYLSTVNNLEERTTFHGFLQQGVSFNMGDLEETPGDDRWDTQMIRSTLYGEVSTDLDWSLWTVIFRYDLEYNTHTGDEIQELREANGSTDDLIQDYYNNFDFREWYGDFRIGDRILFRAGKQQIVWGNTDFFSGLDIIHGYDNTWRGFLEAPNEQRRKPLIMGNLLMEVPEADGSVQVFVRPGWDRDKDIGSTYDVFGGRFSQQPNKGVSFLANNLVTYNWSHKEGDQEDPTYGIRWDGMLGGLDYSFCYMHSFFQDPVVNPSEETFGELGAKYYKEAPRGVLGDFFFKQIDIAGLTFNYYIPFLDIVARCEASYSWDVPYNYGTNFAGGTMPGFAGVIEKDVVRTMFNFDKDVDFTKLLFGSYRPGFLSVQVFDNWVMDYEEDEDIVLQAGYGRRLKEHETIATCILSWNYYYDRITPQIAGGYDLTNDGGFLIPSIAFTYGDHWRFLVEYDMFFDMQGKMPGAIENRHGLLHGYDNNDQLYLRLQYQF